MALTSLLIATLLTAQAPVKLTHTYAKDTKSTYSFEVKIPEDSASIMGDVTFVALDTEGNHSVSAPKITMSRDAGENTIDFQRDKVKIDPKGLVEQIEFNETGIALILPTVLSYLPDAAVEKDKSFDIKEKRETYTLEGSGKLIEVKGSEGKPQVVVEYKLTIQPKSEAQAAVLAFKSTFDPSNGMLLSSEGKVTITNEAPANFTLRKK